MIILDYVGDTGIDLPSEIEVALSAAPSSPQDVNDALYALMNGNSRQLLTFAASDYNHERYELSAQVEESPFFVLRLQTGGLHLILIDGQGLSYDFKNDKHLLSLVSQCAVLTRTYYLSELYKCTDINQYLSLILPRLFPGHTSNFVNGSCTEWIVRYPDINKGSYGTPFSFELRIKTSGQFEVVVITHLPESGFQFPPPQETTQRITGAFQSVKRCVFEWVEGGRYLAPSIVVETEASNYAVAMESGTKAYPGQKGSSFHLPVYLSFAAIYVINVLRLHCSFASCPKCSAHIVFLDGLEISRKAGISDNVLMCRDCECVFEAKMTDAGFAIHREVTDKYAPTLGKTRCGVCDGNGTLQCGTCGGRGYLRDCGFCSGKKTMLCTCNNGKSVCSKCNGSGIATFLFGIIKTKCSNCDGTGQAKHLPCKGSGVLDCSHCGGIGMIDRCSQCSTEGIVKCSKCGGIGWRKA